MIVNLNLDSLAQIASFASYSSESLKDSSEIAKAITLHADWFCSERVRLDACIEDIQQNSAAIAENFEAFSIAVNNTVIRFTEMINEEERDLAVLEESVGDCMTTCEDNVIPVIASGENTSIAISSFASETTNLSSVNSIVGMNKGINVVDFSTLSDM